MRRVIFGYIPANVIPALASFASISIYTRLLTPQFYGDYMAVFSAVLIAQAALFFPLSTGSMRLYPRAERESSTPSFIASLYALFGGLGLVAALFCGAALLGGGLSPGLQGAAWLGLGLLLSRGVMGVSQSLNRMRNQTQLYTILECGQPLLGLGLGVGLIRVMGASAVPVMLGLFLGSLICALANAREIGRAVRQGGLDHALMREFARFGWPLGLAYLTSFVLSYADRFVVQDMAGAGALGVYAAAYSLVERPTTVLCTSVSSATFPLAVRALEHEGREAASVQAGRNGAALLALTMPACLGLALSAPQIAAVLVGPAYRAGVALLIPIMAFTALARGVTAHYVEHSFHLSKRSGAMLLFYMPAAVLNIGLDLIFVPRDGMIAAAWIALACQTGALVLGWAMGHHHFPLRLPRRDMAAVLGATGLMAGVLVLTPCPVTPLGLIERVCLGALAYGAGLPLFGARRIADWARVVARRSLKVAP